MERLIEWLQPLIDRGVLDLNRVHEVPLDYQIIDGRLCRIGRFPDSGTIDELKEAVLCLHREEFTMPNITMIVNGRAVTSGGHPLFGMPHLHTDPMEEDEPGIPAHLLYGNNNAFMIANPDILNAIP